MGNVLSTISRVDSKLLHTNCKHSIYMQQRSRIIRQLMIQFILYGSTSVSSALSYYDDTRACNMYIVSQASTSVINRLEILKYVNIVLIVKQRYQYIRQLLAEAAFTDDECTSRNIYMQDIL
jgi:ribosomal protein L33